MKKFRFLIIDKTEFKGWLSEDGFREIEVAADNKENAKEIVSKQLKDFEVIVSCGELL